MAETEVVINSQPLTVNTIREQQGFKPSSLNNLLTTKSKEVMPPPGVRRLLQTDGKGFSI